MAKKTNAKERVEKKQNLITTIIACIVLLCVLITGVVVMVVRAQNDANQHIAWHGAFLRYWGGDGENALEILARDFSVGLDEQHEFGTIVSVIEGTQAAQGFEWGIWLNGTRITDRPADQIETKNGDQIIWKIVSIDNGNGN